MNNNPYGVDDLILQEHNRSREYAIDIAESDKNTLKTQHDLLIKDITRFDGHVDKVYKEAIINKLLALNNLIEANTYKKMSENVVSNESVIEIASEIYNNALDSTDGLKARFGQPLAQILDNKGYSSLVKMIPSVKNKIIKPKF